MRKANVTAWTTPSS